MQRENSPRRGERCREGEGGADTDVTASHARATDGATARRGGEKTGQAVGRDQAGDGTAEDPGGSRHRTHLEGKEGRMSGERDRWTGETDTQTWAWI